MFWMKLLNMNESDRPLTTHLQSACASMDNSDTARVRESFLKRPLDILLSLSMMLLSMPIWLLIALAIKLEDGGPAFYRQERWGRNGKRFRAYKFRTMVPNSDQEFGIIQAKENLFLLSNQMTFSKVFGVIL